MNSTLENSNVSKTERAGRIVLSAAMIGAVVVAPATTPAWLALAALYPAFTALMAWDPVYHLFAKRDSSLEGELIPVPVRAIRRVSLNGRMQ